jgi:peptidoglycan-associated lipoprotein
MRIKNTLWMILGAVVLAGLGVVVATQQGRIRSLQAAEAGADFRARLAADQLVRRRSADSSDSVAATERTRDWFAELADRVHFGFDRSMIRPTDAEILDEKIAILKGDPHTRIRITGHCDERGTEAYNLALGWRRAIAARTYLEQHGISATRIEILSAGKHAPVDPEHTASAWAKNRRDEFEILDGSDTLSLRP